MNDNELSLLLLADNDSLGSRTRHGQKVGVGLTGSRVMMRNVI